MTINGEFDLKLAGTVRTLKCTFRAIETLEKKILNRGIVRTLSEFISGDISFSDVVNIIHVGLAANKDTRLSVEEIGDELIFNGGFDDAVQVCIELLTFAITGGKQGGHPDRLGKS